MLSVDELADLFNRTPAQVRECLEYISWTQGVSTDRTLAVLSDLLRRTRRRDLVLSQYTMMSYVLRPRKGVDPLKYRNEVEGEFRGKWNAFLKGGAGWLIFPNLVPKLEVWLDNLPDEMRSGGPAVVPAGRLHGSSDCRGVYHALLAAANIRYGFAVGASLPLAKGEDILRVLRSPKFGLRCLPQLKRMAERIDPTKTYPSIWAYYLFDDTLGTVNVNDTRAYAFKDGTTVFVIPKSREADNRDLLEGGVGPLASAVRGRYVDGDITYVLISTVASRPDRS